MLRKKAAYKIPSKDSSRIRDTGIQASVWRSCIQVYRNHEPQLHQHQFHPNSNADSTLWIHFRSNCSKEQTEKSSAAQFSEESLENITEDNE